jgi:hypothetical protein
MVAMFKTPFIKTIVERPAPLAYAAAAAWLAGGITRAFDPNKGSGEDVIGVAGYLALAFFALALIITAPALLAVAREATSDLGARFAAVGMVLLGLTCTTSVINGHDLSFFVVIAPLTNALWLFGSIGQAVALRRGGRVPTWMWVGLPLCWVVAIPGGSWGFSALASIYWFAFAQRADERAPAAVVAA